MNPGMLETKTQLFQVDFLWQPYIGSDNAIIYIYEYLSKCTYTYNEFYLLVCW